MKLYDGKSYPNPRRVTIYLTEKGINLEKIQVNISAGENKTPEFLKINPLGKIPVLELDDGTFLPESAAIVEYLEERFPDPPMIGTTPEERAQVRATERVASDIFTRLALVLLHTHPAVKQIRPNLVQRPEVAEALQPSLDQLFDQLETRIGEHEFLAGPRPTIADCTLFALMDISDRRFGHQIDEKYPRMRRWYERFRARPSAQIAP